MPQCFVQYFDFLSKEENHLLLKRTIKTEKDFISASVIDYTDDYPEWRKSRVAFDNLTLERFYSLLKQKIVNKYQEVCKTLNIEHLEKYDIDIQLTAHNDGDYFKMHTDNGAPETSNRILTFVYYFHKLPKAFMGGELVVYCPEEICIPPDNNMIIFFNPQTLHEVKLVRSPQKNFEDSRFTLNGWFLKPNSRL